MQRRPNNLSSGFQPLQQTQLNNAKSLPRQFKERTAKSFNMLKAHQNIEIPDYIEIEPLKLECQHFLHCIETGKTPRSDGENGYITVKALEDAEKIMFGAQREKLDDVDYALSRAKKQ